MESQRRGLTLPASRSLGCSPQGRIALSAGAAFRKGCPPPQREDDDVSQAPIKLDRIDMKILIELQKNGRMTNVTLADAVGLSASPCLFRVKRLEQSGYITGYGAHVALPKLGETVTVFTEITLTGHTREYFQRFEQTLRGVEEAMECHLVSGGYDYLVKFVTRGLPHYQDVIEALLERNIGIAKYFSYIVLRTPISRSELPLDTLFGEAVRPN